MLTLNFMLSHVAHKRKEFKLPDLLPAIQSLALYLPERAFDSASLPHCSLSQKYFV